VPTTVPPVVEAPMDKLLRLKQLQQRLADLNRRIAVEAPPRPRPWHSEARPEQLPPGDGDWSIYLACCGRGWGKTRAGAEWIAVQAATHPGTEWAVITPTFREVRRTCIEGRSGLLNAFLPGELEGYNASNAQLRLANGSRIWGYSADKPDRLRGSNLSGAWIDELCSMVHAQQLWAEALTPALRIGDRPRVFITTPRPVPLLRELLARDDGSVLTVHGSTWNNEANLSKTALEEMRIRHQGTRLGRQELLGELIEDVEGALWTREHSKTPGSPSRPSSSPASSSGSTRPSPAASTPTRPASWSPDWASTGTSTCSPTTPSKRARALRWPRWSPPITAGRPTGSSVR
jgi:phage terminase large subunit-like protein